MPFVLSATGPDALPKTQEEVEERRKARQARQADKGKKPSHRISKKKRAGVIDETGNTTELLWCGKTKHELIDFESIPAANKFFGQHDGFFIGSVGLKPGIKGGKGGFQAYIKQPKVIERLEAEGFQQAGPGAPHPWFLVLKPGVLSPAEKAILRSSLTPEKRTVIETNRLAALKRQQERGSFAPEGCKETLE